MFDHFRNKSFGNSPYEQCSFAPSFLMLAMKVYADYAESMFPLAGAGYVEHAGVLILLTQTTQRIWPAQHPAQHFLSLGLLEQPDYAGKTA